ncbi:peptidoglycan-binding protein [Streptomyces sp. NPDC053367]|uniref:peptidoglycan-binding protein n=1 Tax=Streptomyces sp. NPDC053367 TaxID=3365700 RepID=UPI0037D648E5
MTDTQGRPCPECGALPGPDHTPSCGCGLRAAEALREARTAEAAAAEDFDPLRIRPYVDLDAAGSSAGAGPGQRAHAGPEAAGPGSGPAHPDDEPTQALPAVPPTAPTAPEAPEAATTALPTPLVPSAVPPSDQDLRLFETAAAEPGPSAAGRGASHRGRRGRTVLLAAGGAVVAVVAAAGLASGMFSYDTPSRDTALPSDVREAAPEVRTSEAQSPAPAPSGTSASPGSASPSPSESASPSPSESPSPSPSEPSASPTPTPSATPSSPSPTPTTASAEPVDSPDGGPVLRRGDYGPEVTELQQRLRQLYLYNGEINGNFTPPVEDALRNYQWARGLADGSELGVYDQPTRTMLESETSEP